MRPRERKSHAGRKKVILLFPIGQTKTDMKREFHRHCCPACGQRVGWSRLYLRAWTWTRWPCESCGTPLTFHLVSRLLCALLVGAWIGFWGVFVLPYLPLWVSIVVCCIGSFAVFQADRISVVETTRSDLQGEEPQAGS